MPRKTAQEKAAQEQAAQEQVAEEPVEQAAPRKTTKRKTQTAPREKKLRITLVKSPIGKQTRQKLTVKALGFNRVNETRVHPNNPSVRGMIFKVNHLLMVEEVEE
jgi:large subunit ribosomal protein L30